MSLQAAARSVGKLSPSNSVLLVCDVQVRTVMSSGLEFGGLLFDLTKWSRSLTGALQTADFQDGNGNKHY